MKRIRGILENEPTSFDYVAESMLFYSMVPAADGSLATYHARLVQQAKKCHFQCSDCPKGYQRRSIRDRLLASVRQELQKEILRKFTNPTAEDILEVCNENNRFQMSPGWPIILSYLPLSDLVNFGRSHWKLAEIVDEQLKRGLELIIDKETLWKYPPADNMDLYTKYVSPATSIVIDDGFGIDRDFLVQSGYRRSKMATSKTTPVTTSSVNLDRPGNDTPVGQTIEKGDSGKRGLAGRQVEKGDVKPERTSRRKQQHNRIMYSEIPLPAPSPIAGLKFKPGQSLLKSNVLKLLNQKKGSRTRRDF